MGMIFGITGLLFQAQIFTWSGLVNIGSTLIDVCSNSAATIAHGIQSVVQTLSLWITNPWVICLLFGALTGLALTKTGRLIQYALKHFTSDQTNPAQTEAWDQNQSLASGPFKNLFNALPAGRNQAETEGQHLTATAGYSHRSD